MKSLILAGGKGTRFAEETKSKPKPLIEINKTPMLIHIIDHYINFDVEEFVILGGYKYEMIVDYFQNFCLKIKSGEFKYKNSKVLVLNTGEETMTGGRVKQAIEELKLSDFFLTYGDGISNVDISKLYECHKLSSCLTTLTAVRPPARFGRLELEGDLVISFGEKNQSQEGWINGGFFVMNAKIADYIANDQTILEREPLETLAKEGQLNSYKHFGFWQPVDTIREKELLEKIMNEGVL